MSQTDLSKDRFEFGKNWESFSHLVDDERLSNAKQRLTAFLGLPDLSGRTFFDIGCGSGLHALAALTLGAKQVTAIDIDPYSVSTTQAVLARFWGGANVSVRNLSVFELEQHPLGQFDIVYSWGVLHHTGDMNRAIRIAAGHTRPGGLFAVALYGKTRYCGIWTRIKHWYVNAPPAEQARAERWYVRLFGFYMLL